MSWLALDCATDACTVALQTPQGVLMQHQVAQRRHNALLVPAIQALLSQAHMMPAALSGMIVGIGPGSFVGVRLAVGVAQGLALSHEIPLHGVSTLQVVAQVACQQTGARRVAIAEDARAGQIYYGVYHYQQGIMRPSVADQVIPLADLVVPQEVDLLIGGGWSLLDVVPQYCQLHPRADMMFGLIDTKTSHAGAPEAVQPVYLQGTRPWSKQ